MQLFDLSVFHCVNALRCDSVPLERHLLPPETCAATDVVSYVRPTLVNSTPGWHLNTKLGNSPSRLSPIVLPSHSSVGNFTAGKSFIQWHRLHRERGHVPPLLQMAGHRGTVSRRTTELTELYWPSRKRSPKRQIVLVELISEGARQNKVFFACAVWSRVCFLRRVFFSTS